MLEKLQARISKDGTDADLIKEFSDVENKSDRMKALIRLGIRYERMELLKNNVPYNDTVQDVALNQNLIFAKIGSEEMIIAL